MHRIFFAAASQLCTTELQKKQAVQRNELPHDAHIHEHLLVGLDLLSGLAEGLGQQCEPLLLNCIRERSCWRRV